jgi:anaerobic magnesium-protoporphyrin IX monomethyl ester cyclase
MSIDLLLSHGYCLAEDEHEREIMMPYPPLGLLSLAAYLKREGRSVEVYDTTFGDLEGFADVVRTCRPRLVGLSTNLMTRASVLRMIAVARDAGVRVVLGGPEAAPNAEEYLRRGADAVVIGEGEQTLNALLAVEAWTSETLARINGLAFLADDAVHTTPPRALIQPLDALPWPDREAIDLDRYLQAWRTHHGHTSVSLLTSRGCPFTCTWCSHAVFGQSHRRRSPEHVADEVAWIRQRYNPDRLWFADDVFTLNRPWTTALAAVMGERGLQIPFECISRADRLDERMADDLASLGCHRLWIGAESGSQRILDRMQRRTDVADVQRKTALLQERGIEVGMFIMLGFDGETEDDLRATVEHLKIANPDIFLTTVAYPIRATVFHDEVAGRVEAELPWDERTDRDLRIRGRRSRAYYRHATRWMVNEVAHHRAINAPSTSLRAVSRHWLAARAGRAGMWLTRHQTEAGPSGRGWSDNEERARKGLA